MAKTNRKSGAVQRQGRRVMPSPRRVARRAKVAPALLTVGAGVVQCAETASTADGLPSRPPSAARKARPGESSMIKIRIPKAFSHPLPGKGRRVGRVYPTAEIYPVRPSPAEFSPVAS